MMRALLYWLVTRKWLIVAFLVAGFLLLLPAPSGLTEDGLHILSITVAAVILFITESVPLPTVALLIAVFQVLLGISTPNDVARSFMSDSVFFIMGSLMLAAVIVRQKLDRRIALGLVRLTGPGIPRIALGFVAVSALIASVIGEHTVAAIMLPVGISLVSLASEGQPRNPTGLQAVIMVSIAYGCSMAAMGSPSGGARNAIILEYWDRLYHQRVSYFQWLEYAYPMVLLMIPAVAYIIVRTFSPEVRDLSPAIARLKDMVREEGTMRPADWLTIGIFGFTLILWITLSSHIGLGIPALIGVSLYMITGLIEWEDINRGVNWGVILIYAAAISLGVGIQETGAAHWLASNVLQGMGAIGVGSGLSLWVTITVITTVTANIMTPGPAVAVLGPVFLGMANLSHSSTLAAGFLTAISSSFAYLTILGSPARTIIYSSGYVRAADFVKAGWKMTLLSILVANLLAALYWPLLGLPH